MVEIVNKMSTLHIHIHGPDCLLYSGILIMDIVNHSAGLIVSYHMLDAVGRGLFTPPE